MPLTESNPFAGIKMQPTSIRDVAYKALKEAICVGRLHPGERLIEERVAQLLSVSRTPLREAIQKLELEGLVTRLPSGGVQVAEVSPHDLSDLYVVRMALEGVAARQAAERSHAAHVASLKEAQARALRFVELGDISSAVSVGMEFHAILHEASGNSRNIDLLDSVMAHMSRYRCLAVSTRLRPAWEEHEEIVAAIERRDPDAAEKAMRDHIAAERDVVLNNARSGLSLRA